MIYGEYGSASGESILMDPRILEGRKKGAAVQRQSRAEIRSNREKDARVGCVLIHDVLQLTL